MALLSAAATRAEESAVSAGDAKAAPMAAAQTANTAPVAAAGGDTATYCQDCDPVADFIARAGIWAVQSSGSPTKVGEYQNVTQSSPMFDVEGIWSNGERSIDFSASGSDNDTDIGRLRYYGPGVSADLGYERFDHQLDAHDYAGWNFGGVNNSAGPAYSNGGGLKG